MYCRSSLHLNYFDQRTHPLIDLHPVSYSGFRQVVSHFSTAADVQVLRNGAKRIERIRVKSL